MVLRFFSWLLAAAFLSPILLVVWMSFTPSAMFRLPFDAFSLRWYYAVFAHPGFTNAFFLSLQLAAVSCVIAVLLAFMCAYALNRGPDFPGKAALQGLFLSPLIVPHVVYGIAMLQFVNGIGFYNTFTSLVVAHVVCVTPYAIRTIDSSLKMVPIEVEWAAMNLGAPRVSVLARIVLPMCLRGIAATFLLCGLLSFSELTVTIFMVGPNYQTLPLRIYNYMSDQLDPTVAAISSMLIALSLVLALLLARLGNFRDYLK